MTICADCQAALQEPAYLSLDGQRALCAICLLADARRSVRARPPDPHHDAEVWILEELYARSAA